MYVLGYHATLKPTTYWKPKHNNVCYVPTAKPNNAIEANKAIGYWSGPVGMSYRELSGRLLLAFCFI